MANAKRGEVEIVADGETHLLVATFGAFAAIQADLKLNSLEELPPLLSTGDANAIHVCLHRFLQGGGHRIDREEMMSFRPDNMLEIPQKVGEALSLSGMWVPGKAKGTRAPRKTATRTAKTTSGRKPKN